MAVPLRYARRSSSQAPPSGCVADDVLVRCDLPKEGSEDSAWLVQRPLATEGSPLVVWQGGAAFHPVRASWVLADGISVASAVCSL